MMKKTILLLLLALMVSLTNLSGTALASPEKNFYPMSKPTNENLLAVWGTAANNVYAVGNNGVILHYDGTNWSRMTSGTTTSLWGIWGTSDTNIFAVGWAGHILHYNGTIWSTVKTVPNVMFLGIGGAGSYICASGRDITTDKGVIYLKEGSAWTKKYTSTSVQYYNDIWGYSYYGMQDYIYLAGGNIYNSEVILYQPDLINPVTVEKSVNYDLNGIWGAAPSEWDIYAVGGYPHLKIQHYDFSDWQETIITTTAWNTLSDVWGVSANDVYAVGMNGKILHYDGTSWSTITSGTTKPLHGVWGSSNNDFFIVGNSGTLLRLNTGPNKPKIISPANGATNVSLTPTLQSSTYVDTDPGDTHASSQWQITSTMGNYSSPVYDSGIDTAKKTSLTVPDGTLTSNTIYYWHVRYQDNNGAWSDWSNAKSFTTLIPAPTITSIDPVSAAPGDAISVVITGDNLGGATGLSLPGISIASFTLVNSTQITATIDVPLDAVDGPRDLSVTTPGGIATLANGFIVEEVLGPPIEAPIPTITSLYPVSANLGDMMSIIIVGSNFFGATEVDFGQGINVDSFTIDNPSQITTNISITLNATVGTRDISVTTPGGIATLTAGLTVEKLLLPQPEPEPESEPESKRIPGFPIESSIISLIVVVAILLRARKMVRGAGEPHIFTSKTGVITMRARQTLQI